MLVIAAQQIPDNVAALLGAFRNVPDLRLHRLVLGKFWSGHWIL